MHTLAPKAVVWATALRLSLNVSIRGALQGPAEL